MLTRREFLKVSAASGALFALGNVANAKANIEAVVPDENFALEKGRKIPVFADVDMVIAGGSSRAVAAAAAAAKSGLKVFLAAGLPYLGDDICGSFLFDTDKKDRMETALAEKIFPEKGYPTPMKVKKTLEDTLIDSGVAFLYSSYVTNVLTDASGNVAGVVIVNRSGRQAVRSKVVIDATHEASVARMAGAGFTSFVPGIREFQFTVVGNKAVSKEGIVRSEAFPMPFEFNGKTYPVTRYTVAHEIKAGTYAEIMAAEQKARTLVWDPDQVDSSDLLWYIPQQSIKSETPYAGGSRSIRGIPVGAMKPAGVKNLYVLGPCADMSRKDAEALMRPVQAMTLGEMLGESISDQVKAQKASKAVTVKQSQANANDFGRIGEFLVPLRTYKDQEYVECGKGALPVLGSYDVIVLGGGTAGAPAGISAARHGSKTLMLEYLHGLGGLATLGLIGVYWDGYRGGFTSVIDKASREIAPADHPRQPSKDGHNIGDWKQEWYRSEFLKAGGELWYGVLGCGALVEDNKVKGLVVATPEGRGVILSKVLIDSTGSADIAIAAGAEYDYTGKKTLAVQGAGMGKKDPGDYYANNDWLFIDDTDILDVSRVFVQSKEKFRNSYDMVKMPQTRERRRVVGEYVISVYDVLNHRRYPDTISYHKSSFDTHGMIVDPYFILSPPMARHTIYDADVPLRALLPKGLDGILTTGLGASAHRDAMPVIRMQPCLQNQGYAVGYLCSMAVKEGVSVRKVDMKKVQKHLVEIGNLPERVLSDKEFKGFSLKEMKAAAKSVANNYDGLGVLLTDTELCKKLVREQIKSAEGEAKVNYASVLCILGDSQYAPVLRDKIAQTREWDEGWHYKGMHQFGMCMSRLDSLIIALGRSGDEASLDVVLDKARMLFPEDYFSHFRAIAMATENIGSTKAADTLYAMLTMPGMRYHAVSNYTEARDMNVPNTIDVTFRNKALKELHVARALYMCGDKNGLGEETLMRYAYSLQGHYARYATEILGL